MASRKKLIQLVIYFFSSLNFSFSNIIIKNNTEWLRDKNITQNVIVKPGATLTIKEDVSVYIHNENKESENSGVQFIISGTLKLLGSRQNPIFIGPKSKSNDKNHWQGLKFDSTQSGSVIDFLKLSNATNALEEMLSTLILKILTLFLLTILKFLIRKVFRFSLKKEM